ncbi:MAG: HD domain-containing protein [Burkholderiaceae bacterium]
MNSEPVVLNQPASGQPASLPNEARSWLRSDSAGINPAEPMLAHAGGVAQILREIGADPATQAAAWLYPFDSAVTLEVVTERFGADVAQLCGSMRQLRALREIHLHQGDGKDRGAASRIETLRRMLLAMSVDLRVVLLRLASRLQNLRTYAATREKPTPALCHETIEVLAPLANRLGLWQLKWELEDLAFRFLEPTTYYDLASRLALKRHERDELVQQASRQLSRALSAAGIDARVSGRPKHILSLWRKMKSKQLAFEQVHDLLALRVVVDSVQTCYEALDAIHQVWKPVPGEYDDYITRPKPNGYQSLHSVVRTEEGRAIEVQVRTTAMHEAAEYGAAAHWQYKEGAEHAGKAGNFESRVAWLRQLLDWQQEVGAALGGGENQAQMRDDHVYVLTPQARVMALPLGSTPVDFAYHLHSDLGHRCRGARVNGRLVPLTTPLQTGQTVDIITVRADDAASGSRVGPSRDWLNPELGFLASRRARSKVRQWFAALETKRERAAGRTTVERVLQREGQTKLSLDTLAERLGFDDTAQLYSAVNRGEIGPRAIEQAAGRESATYGPARGLSLTPRASVNTPRRTKPAIVQGVAAIVVDGVGSLLTSLAGCCKPQPGDPICGFITLGRGIRIHCVSCPVLGRLRGKTPDRILDANWSTQPLGGGQRRRKKSGPRSPGRSG